jgi:hypothetical protein
MLVVYNLRILCRQTVTVFLSPGTIPTNPRAGNESWPKSKRNFHETRDRDGENAGDGNAGNDRRRRRIANLV